MNNKSYRLVPESLTEALLKLLEEKQIADINVSELCQRAGVSRISYYRNYDSMSDILLDHMKKTDDEWWQSLSGLSAEEFATNFWNELCGHYRKNEKFIKMLYANDLSFLIKEHIFSCCSIGPECDDTQAYERSVLAGALYGFMDEWIRRGMKDIPGKFGFYMIIEDVFRGSK